MKPLCQVIEYALCRFFVAFAFCVLLTRLFYLHIWEHEVLSDYVISNRKMVNVVDGRRGMIVDTQGIYSQRLRKPTPSALIRKSLYRRICQS